MVQRTVKSLLLMVYLPLYIKETPLHFLLLFGWCRVLIIVLPGDSLVGGDYYIELLQFLRAYLAVGTVVDVVRQSARDAMVINLFLPVGEHAEWCDWEE